MDAPELQPILGQLEGNIDDLEAALSPILTTPLSDSASKLPVLDKAKLYALTTYSIESLLFSYLRLNGVNAKEHPVFEELNRVKRYFAKIKAAETPAAEEKRPNLTLDKGAAGRIIKHGLAGNEQYDQGRALQLAKERAAAQLKLKRLSSPNQHAASATAGNSESKKRKIAEVGNDGAEDEDAGRSSADEPDEPSSPAPISAKSQTGQSLESRGSIKSQRKERKRQKKLAAKQSSSAPQTSASSNVEESTIMSLQGHKPGKAPYTPSKKAQKSQGKQRQQPRRGMKKSEKKKKNMPRNSNANS